MTTSHVGSDYKLIPEMGTLRSTDYLFAFVAGPLTITAAPLTIKANDTSQPFGSQPVLSASFIGLVNGDTAGHLPAPAVLSTTATSASLPGIYPITSPAPAPRITPSRLSAAPSRSSNRPRSRRSRGRS